MLKARATDNKGKQIIVFGLSRDNITRMQAGSPVRVTGESLGLIGIASITIFAGGTEEGMEAQFREYGFIGPTTIVTRGDS